ncbi:hypothetical protein [Ornithinimicrobium cavernae]|uniref:hypothetical protein n=1 Tax=Ornithinimicrobium cavernae TaxID=2666047 RepID=UPI000D697366|nr:hypothetical protein [Ornithinimicrobium cavernae]
MRRLMSVMAATVLAATVAGCGSGDDPGPVSTSGDSAAETSVAAPPATPDDDVETTAPPAADATEDAAAATAAAPSLPALEDADQRAAAEAVVSFWALRDRLSQDPEIKVQELASVARGQAVSQTVSTIQAQRDEKSVQGGDTVVTVEAVETVVEGERYAVTVCLDLTDVEFDGEKPDRSDLGGDLQRITYAVQSGATSQDQFFVTEDPMEYEPCAP